MTSGIDSKMGAQPQKQITARWPSSLILGALVLPAMLFAVVAWWDRVTVMDEALKDAQYTAAVFSQEAHGVIDVRDLIIDLVNDRVRGMSWDQISGSNELHQSLAALVRGHPQVRSLFLVDPSGRVRNSSAVFPLPPISVADRGYFAALREQDTGLYIGRLIQSRVLRDDVFNVARRRSTISEDFDGVVVATVSPTYITSFWKAADLEPGDETLLVRRDGAILAREPPADADTPPLGADSPLMRRISRDDSGRYYDISAIGMAERGYAFQRVGGFPIYIVHGDAVANTLRIWYDHLLTYGGYFAIATLAMVLLAIVATSKANREIAALRELHQAAERRLFVEQQLRQMEKVSVLGQMASGMAHDFGNVLQIIGGSLELLRIRVAPGDTRHVTSALDGTARARKMVESLLRFVRQRPADSTVFELNATLRSMDGLLHQALGSSAVRLELVLESGACHIRADRNQTELAILNLAVNARDAMPRGGTLTVTTAAVTLNDQPTGLSGDFCAVTVKDTGAGMPPDVLARALEPFFTTKESDKGTGLGLSMVYGFARRCAGDVTIESVVGRGTTVVIYLPLSRTEAKHRAVEDVAFA